MTALFTHPFTCPHCLTVHEDDDAIYRDALIAEGRVRWTYVTGTRVRDDIPEQRETRCVECYRNPVCPDRCDEPHEGPADEQTTFECPTTGAEWVWCDACDDWQEGRYANHQRVNGEWYCDPFEHDYYSCESCNELVYVDDARYDEWNECTYCPRCWSSRAEDDVDEDDYEYAPPAVLLCDTCGTSVSADAMAFDPVNERRHCAHCAMPEAA